MSLRRNPLSTLSLAELLFLKFFGAPVNWVIIGGSGSFNSFAQNCFAFIFVKRIL